MEKVWVKEVGRDGKIERKGMKRGRKKVKKHKAGCREIKEK